MKKLLLIGLCCVTFTTQSDSLHSIIRIDRDSNRVSVNSVYGNIRCDASANTHNTIFLSPKQSVTLATLVDCGGGNHYDNFLILANKINNRWNIIDQIIVGNDRTFVATDIKLVNKMIVVEGKVWLENDAHCCPSETATKQFIIENSLFKQK